MAAIEELSRDGVGTISSLCVNMVHFGVRSADMVVYGSQRVLGIITIQPACSPSWISFLIEGYCISR